MSPSAQIEMKPTQNQNNRSRSDILFAIFQRGMAPALDQFEPASLHFGRHFRNHFVNQFLLVRGKPGINIARPFRSFLCFFTVSTEPRIYR
jgi:hypothetical protein